LFRDLDTIFPQGIANEPRREEQNTAENESKGEPNTEEDPDIVTCNGSHLQDLTLELGAKISYNV